MAKKNNFGRGKFKIEFLNATQQMAYAAYQRHDVNFLIGVAGTGKTHLSMAFAINDILNKQKSKIVLTRPIVEAGEKLGFLPGDFQEKVNPYMMPLFDCMDILLGTDESPQRELIENSIEIAPIAFMRGRSFHDSICIFDEAQNATMTQLKLFLSRLGNNSKMIVTGDPRQSDLICDKVALMEVVDRLETVPGVSIVKFNNETIVRHELVGKMLEKLP